MESVESGFKPIFIVGAPRSGTTMLAVLLNRHSHIAIPPETQFFSEYIQETDVTSFARKSRLGNVEDAASFNRISDLGLSVEEIMAEYELLPNEPACLLQAILAAYTAKCGKKRAGEKSPRHLEYVPHILSLYPEAKVICIVRDGRDVVRSLVKTPWAEPGNPRRKGLFCMQWTEYANKIIEYRNTLPSEKFRVFRYEDVLTSGEEVLREICQFIDERFEIEMLQAGQGSGVVPGWETRWKGKAEDGLDPSRAGAWRRQASTREICWLNMFMGKELGLMGYKDTTLKECSIWLRCLIWLQILPYRRIMQPVSLLGLRLIRVLKSKQS
ncbi:sulfotransferase family protein [Desulfogranum japonicum]|uniref:sulfotransferase family protein n=1 Tax=Desulfogranum japonicum TaxID=231447 RepID=UPI00041D8E39|nr:sulfotransferase [Desulfogranum japonicum]